MQRDLSHTAQMVEFMELCGIGFGLEGRPCVDFGWQDIALKVKAHHSDLSEALAALGELVDAATRCETEADLNTAYGRYADAVANARAIIAKHGKGE
jgi:hypothetical protein